jgi:hypothetical protein
MAERYNTDRVIQTLKRVLPILQAKTNKFWFMGSMVPTALNGALYREVHDFDIIVITEHLPELLNALYRLGYAKKQLNFFRVSELLGVYVFSHPTLLDIGFFVIAEENRLYTITAGAVRVVIPMKNLEAKKYTFHHMSFSGILPSFSYRLALLAKHNPKRQKEMIIYRSHGVKPAPWPFYDFTMFGKNANWVMNTLNSLLILIGRTRVLFGLPYDPWQ